MVSSINYIPIILSLILGLILSLTIKILNSFLYNNDFQKTNFIIILRSSILLGVQDFLNLFRKKNENIESLIHFILSWFLYSIYQITIYLILQNSQDFNFYETMIWGGSILLGLTLYEQSLKSEQVVSENKTLFLPLLLIVHIIFVWQSQNVILNKMGINFIFNLLFIFYLGVKIHKSFKVFFLKKKNTWNYLIFDLGLFSYILFNFSTLNKKYLTYSISKPILFSIAISLCILVLIKIINRQSRNLEWTLKQNKNLASTLTVLIYISLTRILLCSML